jgi:hypothetical protein
MTGQVFSLTAEHIQYSERFADGVMAINTALLTCFYIVKRKFIKRAFKMGIQNSKFSSYVKLGAML